MMWIWEQMGVTGGDMDSKPGQGPFGPSLPAKTPVRVLGGQYSGDSGLVVDRVPDLRPGSVWVRLTRAGVRLVPAYRLHPITPDNASG